MSVDKLEKVNPKSFNTTLLSKQYSLETTTKHNKHVGTQCMESIVQILLLYIHTLKKAFEILRRLIHSNYSDNVIHIFEFLGTKKIEDKLFAEIKGRIKEDDISAPVRKGPYYYYKKTLEGKEYVQYCRRRISDNQKVPSVNDTMPTGPDAPPEHVILDENIKAQQHEYYSIGTFKVRSYHYHGILILFYTFILFCFLISALFLFYFKFYFFSG